MLHTGAYWLLWSLRSLMPKRSTFPIVEKGDHAVFDDVATVSGKIRFPLVDQFPFVVPSQKFFINILDMD